MSNFLLPRLFLSDRNFFSKEGNFNYFFSFCNLKDIAELKKIIIKIIKKVKKNRVKNGKKKLFIYAFLADVKNRIFWFKIEIFFMNEHKSQFSLF